MKKPGGTRQGRPCAGSALTARAGPIAPACGRLCPRLCRPLVSARRSRGRSRLPAAAFARRIGRVAGPLAACPFSGAVTMLLPCTSCLGASRRAQGACRISGPGGGRPCGARAPRVRVLEPRRPARAARDRACRRPSFSARPLARPWLRHRGRRGGGSTAPSPQQQLPARLSRARATCIAKPSLQHGRDPAPRAAPGFRCRPAFALGDLPDAGRSPLSRRART